MESVFAGLTFFILLIYLDDIIVYSKTFEEHLENLSVVLERLKNANLKLNPKKCSLLCTKVAFHGHEVSEQVIATDPSKVEVVKDWPQPKSATDVRQFVGFASYYRKVIPNFATVCKPLHRLNEKAVFVLIVHLFVRYAHVNLCHFFSSSLCRRLAEAPV